MLYLLTVSLVWAFSFSLFKENLSGFDPNLMACLRLLLALPLFLPFLRLESVPRRARGRLMLIGAVQYGLMYGLLNFSYGFLAAHEVALCTVFTPVYVILIDDYHEGRWRAYYWGTAMLAAAGAGVILLRFDVPERLLRAVKGFFLMQGSNFCFAYGQIAYRRLRPVFSTPRDREVYALPYFGAVLITCLTTALSGGWGDLARLGSRQVYTLFYLGVLASGLCFFWWNKGAALTHPGVLAVFNNLKIPLAVCCSLFIFREPAALSRLLPGGAILCFAFFLAERRRRRTNR